VRLESGHLNLHDLVGRHPIFLDVMTWPTTFHKVWQVLGWNIQLFHTQLLVTPTSDPSLPPGPTGWHQDNDRMNLELEVELQPRVSMKVGYFLADIPEPGMGNFCVIPGSHLTRRLMPTTAAGRPAKASPGACESRLAGSAQPRGARDALRARVSDALAWNWR